MHNLQVSRNFMKRQLLIYLTILISACGEKNSTNDNKTTDAITKNTIKDTQATEVKNIFEYVRDTFLIGEINNDKKLDTAFLHYDLKIQVDTVQENYCANPACNITILFSNKIPSLVINNSIGVVVKKLEDLNNDNANEIMVCSMRHDEGWWQKIYVYTFKNKWIPLVATDAFVADDKDYENRIIKKNSQYYLIGDDKWNDSTGVRSLKIKI